MIALILGTSEGKILLKKLNEFTDNILITTATDYGKKLLEEYRYKISNCTALNKQELKSLFIKNNINIVVDVTHPYAAKITENAQIICKDIGCQYIRYERPSIIDKYKDNKNVILIDSIQDIKGIVKNDYNITLLNTTGSKSIDQFMNLNLQIRIIHRVLPTIDSIQRCLDYGVKIDDIIAMKGPFSTNLNYAIIKEYNIQAVVLKDSGTIGGTEEKIEAVKKQGILSIVLKRKQFDIDFDGMLFQSIDKLINYLKKVLT